MINEFILLAHILFIAISALVAARLGKSILVTFVALTIVCANLFVLKQIVLGGLSATAADALAIGSMLGLNMLQEFFGSQSAKEGIIATFFASIFFVIASMIHLWYTPSASDAMQEHFVAILAPAPALVILSTVVYALSQIIDFALYALLKVIFHNRLLVVRNYIAIGVSQLVDTILFTFGMFYLGIIQEPASVIIVSFSIKFIITLIATPIISFARPGKTA